MQVTTHKIDSNTQAKRSFAHWYLAATGILIAGVASGCDYCLPLLVGLTIVEFVHFAIRGQSFTALPALTLK